MEPLLAYFHFSRFVQVSKKSVIHIVLFLNGTGKYNGSMWNSGLVEPQSKAVQEGVGQAVRSPLLLSGFEAGEDVTASSADVI